jgi:ATP-dependent Lon protease
VRNLERELASLCRKAVKKMLTDGKKSITVNNKVLTELLGHRKFKEDEHLGRSKRAGVDCDGRRYAPGRGFGVRGHG